MSIGLKTILWWSLFIVIIASFPAVIWFYKFRKALIRRQVAVIETFERALKPRDKRYWLLGYLVGFRAKYWINRGPFGRAWIFYTTPPYHVFFYLPVIILFKKRERLDLTVEVRGLRLYKGTSYIVAEDAPYTLKQQARNELATLSSNPSTWEQALIDTGKRKYQVYHRGDRKLWEASMKLLRIMEREGTVYRVVVSGDKSAVHVSFEPKDPGRIESVVRGIEELAKNF